MFIVTVFPIWFKKLLEMCLCQGQNVFRSEAFEEVHKDNKSERNKERKKDRKWKKGKRYKKTRKNWLKKILGEIQKKKHSINIVPNS